MAGVVAGHSLSEELFQSWQGPVAGNNGDILLVEKV